MRVLIKFGERSRWLSIRRRHPLIGTDVLTSRCLSWRCLIAVCLLSTILRSNGETRDERLAVLRSRVLSRLADLDKALQTADGMPSVWTDKALAILETDGSPKASEAFLDKAFATQDMNRASPSFGDVPLQTANRGIKDANAIEFTMWSAELALLGYATKFGDEFKSRMLEHERAGLAAVRRQVVRLDYTNIWLLKHLNLLLIGRRVGDRSAITEGCAGLTEWLTFTRRNGITEYDSPTYAAVDLAVLLGFYSWAPTADSKADARAALDLLWTDLAGNLFVPRGSLSGPHSRVGDFAFTHGPVEYFYWLEGLTPEPADTSSIYSAWLAGASADYVPSSSIKNLAAARTKVVEERFGRAPNQERYNYITPYYSIGSSSAYYEKHNLPITIEFPGPSTPVVSILAHEFTRPFLDRVARITGQFNPDYARTGIAAVQEANTLLTVMAFPSQGARPTSNAFSIVVPVDTDSLLIDARQVSLSNREPVTVRNGSTLLLTRPGAALAIRVLAPRFDGDSQQVLSLATTTCHSVKLLTLCAEETAKGLRPLSQVAFALHADDCSDANDCAKISDSVAHFTFKAQLVNHTAVASLEAGGSLMEAAVDTNTGSAVSRKLNRQPLTRAVLAVQTP